jgi:hypothetical protein
MMFKIDAVNYRQPALDAAPTGTLHGLGAVRFARAAATQPAHFRESFGLSGTQFRVDASVRASYIAVSAWAVRLARTSDIPVEAAGIELTDFYPQIVNLTVGA